jgi:hypothetical protein
MADIKSSMLVDVKGDLFLLIPPPVDYRDHGCGVWPFSMISADSIHHWPSRFCKT